MRANSSSSSSRGSQDCGDPQQGEHQGTGGGCHRSPAQPSAPSRRVPAPAATLPSAFLQFLATREPQKRNLIRINSHSPREAEPDVRSELRPRIARGTAAARSAFRGHHHQSFCIFFFFPPLFQALFEDCCQHLARELSAQLFSPAQSTQLMGNTRALLARPAPLRSCSPRAPSAGILGSPEGADGWQ